MAGVGSKAAAVENAVNKPAAAGPTQLGENLVNTNTGQRIPLPTGADTMSRAANDQGVVIGGGSGGGNGLAPNVTGVRVMEPNAPNPTGYVRYQNAAGHAVEPATGQQVGSGAATQANTHIKIEP